MTAATQRNIPGLDALRAISVLGVMAAHSAWGLPEPIRDSILFRTVIGNGAHFVGIFFVISGYLITTLLLREYQSTDGISLGRFYLRRALRIFPPFYFFLIVMGVLWATRIIPEDFWSFVASATYSWSLYPSAHGYFLQHTWSLSIEEIFYVFWPVLLRLVPGRALPICVAFIALVPVARVLLYFMAPSLRGHENYMVQGWIDTMMFGCLLAVSENSTEFIPRYSRYVNAYTAAGGAVLAFFVCPSLSILLPKKISGGFDLAIAPTLVASGISIGMLYLVRTKLTQLRIILSCRFVKHIGIVSYSLYLWQQLFVSREFGSVLLGILCAFVAAEISYFLIEIPALRLRARLSRSRHSIESTLVVTV
jgi:peptidoglycan/LPS O-acetylase OafA/YrhL